MRQDGRSGCPINLALEAFGDRWSLLVLRDMMFGDRRHFRELLAGSEEGIASNILADRLKHLVEDGLLTRDDDPAPGEGGLQPHRARDPAGPGVRPARRLGTPPPRVDRASSASAPSCSPTGGPQLWDGLHGRAAGDPSRRPAPDPRAAPGRRAARRCRRRDRGLTVARPLVEALADLDAIVDAARREPSTRGYFAAVYRSVTAAVADAVDDGVFADGARMRSPGRAARRPLHRRGHRALPRAGLAAWPSVRRSRTAPGTP